MDANIWQVISIIGFSLSGVAFVITIFIYKKFNIPSVMGDLSGRTAAKQIKAIREQNISTGDKQHRSNAFNIERGPLTEPQKGKSSRIGNSKELLKVNKSKELAVVHIEEPKENRLLSNATELLSESTELLSEPPELLSESTGLLSESTGLLSESTGLLNESIGLLSESTGLSNESIELFNKSSESFNESSGVIENGEFQIEKDIVAIHTNVII